MEEQLFRIGNMMALAAWVLLVFLPRWRGVSQAAATLVVPTILAIAYSGLIGTWWSRAEGGFSSLAEVQMLFQQPGLLLAGWFHYLAFDLFVGAWVARECHRDGVPHLVVVPILLLTFLFGPMGYLVSLFVRASWRMAKKRPAQPTAQPTEGNSVSRSLSAFVDREPTLLAAAFLCFAAMLPVGFAAAIDDRTFSGSNVWLKPLKFQMSVGIYLATLAFFMPLAGDAFRRSFAGRFVVWVSIATGILELIYIGWRASRGEASHFNKESVSGQVLYGLMGIGAWLLAGAGPVLAWGVARSHAGGVGPAYRFAVVLGLAVSFVLATAAGAVMSMGSSHFVGTPPAYNPVLPIFGWSRAVGDLRVAHFMGMHAQQLVALVGALVATKPRAKTMVVAFTACYSLVVIALFIQSVAGRPGVPF